MRRRDLGELVLLAAVWGASFLFMRLGAGEFGAIPLSWLRVAGAALVLLPLLRWRGETAALRAHWKPVFVVGVMNSALPFVLFSYALLSITASLSSIFNAASPLFGALIAWLWLKDRLSAPRIAGLFIGFAGVLGLAGDEAGVSGNADATSGALAVLACLLASLLLRLVGQLHPALSHRRAVDGRRRRQPARRGAGAARARRCGCGRPRRRARRPGPTSPRLAVLCTGLAYILYFRLIAHAGPANAIAVTYLIPAFAVLWGGLFLGERPTAAMLAGCAVILLGTALATGLLRPRLRAAG